MAARDHLNPEQFYSCSRPPTPYAAVAVDAKGSKYTVHGDSKREAGRAMSHAIATGHVPAGSQVSGRQLAREARRF